MAYFKKCFSLKRLYRCISIADFILEEHSTVEASKEFNISRNQIDQEIAFLGYIGYNYNFIPGSEISPEVLKKKYLCVLKTLKRIKIKNISKSVKNKIS